VTAAIKHRERRARDHLRRYVMSDDDTEDRAQDNHPVAVQTLEAMLDYAIMEGAELRLPVLVYMLRLARLELTKSTKARAASTGFAKRSAP
jgi:hypothetical protein